MSPWSKCKGTSEERKDFRDQRSVWGQIMLTMVAPLWEQEMITILSGSHKHTFLCIMSPKNPKDFKIEDMR